MGPRRKRDSSTAKSEIQELRRAGVEVLSVTDPKVDEDTAAGVYMQAITFAKNEAYSKEVAFHAAGMFGPAMAKQAGASRTAASLFSAIAPSGSIGAR